MDNNNTWNEISFRRYSNRMNERELELYEIEKEIDNNLDYIYSENENVSQNGVYEDLTLNNCRGIEDWWEIMEEFN